MMASACSAGVRGILAGLVVWVVRDLVVRARWVDWEAEEMERRRVRMRSWVEVGSGRQDLWTREVGIERVVGVRRAWVRLEVLCMGDRVRLREPEPERERAGAIVSKIMIRDKEQRLNVNESGTGWLKLKSEEAGACKCRQ